MSLRSNANPAAERPRSPAMAINEPARAPLRSTGSRPSRSPSAVTDAAQPALATRSPPTMPAPQCATSEDHMPSVSFGGTVGRRLRWRAEGDDEAGHPGTHRLDVGGVLGDGFAADVVRGGPVQPEVAALHEHVGTDRNPTVRRVHHGGVVPGAHNHIGGLPASTDQPVDDGELTASSVGPDGPPGASRSRFAASLARLPLRYLETLSVGPTSEVRDVQGGTDRVGDQVPAVDPDGPPRALFIAALLLAVLTVGAVLAPSPPSGAPRPRRSR